MNIERRYIPATELRAATVNGQTRISGYAAKYGKSFAPAVQKSLGFNERCKQGCFDRALRENQDVMCLRDHNPQLLMGRTRNQTLRLYSDNVGLGFECDLPDTQSARDLAALIKRGDISQCSFAFNNAKDSWTKEKNAAGDWQASRSLDDVDLIDVSAVASPCYDDTEVDVNDDRSLQEIERAFFPNGAQEIRSRAGLVIPIFKANGSSDLDEMAQRLVKQLNTL